MQAHSLFDDVREVVSNLLVTCPANKQSVDSAEIAVVLVLRLRLLADSDRVPMLQEHSAYFNADSARFVFVDGHIRLRETKA